MSIKGHLQADQATLTRRSAARRKLQLEVSGETASGAGNVTLLNLSLTGVLLRTQVRLVAGERIRLAFPDGETAPAKVVWASDDLFGCRFEKPIAQATLSAASLLSPFDGRSPEVAAPALPASDSLGSRVERLRRQRGLSLQALASQIGVSKPALWKWERGEVRPRPAALSRLADVLGVSPAELLFGGSTVRASDAGQPASLHTVLESTKAQVAALLGVEPGAVEVTVSVRE